MYKRNYKKLHYLIKISSNAKLTTIFFFSILQMLFNYDIDFHLSLESFVFNDVNSYPTQ